MEGYAYYMRADLSHYAGKWIAIIDTTVIASGMNAKEVYEAARKIAGGKKFLFTKVTTSETMIL